MNYDVGIFLFKGKLQFKNSNKIKITKVKMDLTLDLD